LDEFGITIDQALSHSFQRWNENAAGTLDTNGKLVWEFLPEEEHCVSETDDWGFRSDVLFHHDKRREHFITNSEKIEKEYGLLLLELAKVYSNAFYSLGIDTKGICILNVNEVSTCLRSWN
jgi:hypothetical protein